MKKFFTILMMVFAITIANAQIVDTVAHYDTIQFAGTADSNVFTVVGDTNAAFTVFESDTMPINGSSKYIEFYINGLDTNMAFVLYINDFMITDSIVGYEYTTEYDTVFNYDSIVSIDTVLLGHPGIYALDTVYAVDTIIANVDSVLVTADLFGNGYNKYYLNGYDTIYGVALGIEWENDTINYDAEITVTNVNILEYDNSLSIPDIQVFENGISIYPNPTKGIVNIEGEYDTVQIYDASGRMLVNMSNSRYDKIDMSRLKPGYYVFKFDNGRTVKVIKM